MKSPKVSHLLDPLLYDSAIYKNIQEPKTGTFNFSKIKFNNIIVNIIIPIVILLFILFVLKVKHTAKNSRNQFVKID